MNTSGANSFCYSIIKFLSTGLVLLAACQQQADVAQHPTKAPKITEQDTVQQAGAISHVSNKVVFDIPTLLPLTIAQIKAKLGKPVDELQADYMNAERGLVYKNHNLLLEVYYVTDAPNKIDVISLVNKRDTTNFEYLLPLGNINLSDNKYQIDTLRGKQPGTYRGIAVRYNLGEADSLVH